MKKEVISKLDFLIKDNIAHIELKDYGNKTEIIIEDKKGQKFLADNNGNLKTIEGLNSSIAEYFTRGKYGENSWRGNCSGLLIKDLLQQFNVSEFCDPMVGSGTSLDVARDLGIKCTGLDLNPKYGGFNIIKNELDKAYNFIFVHPPYFVFKGSKMPVYSGNMWGETPHEDDGSHIHDEILFTKWFNKVLWKCYQSLKTGGRMAILMGDSRYRGKYYSMLKAMNIYGELENIIIKKQFNCISDKINYKNKNFIPIQHEYVAIIKKNDSCSIPCLIVSKKEFNIFNVKNVTWKALIYSTIEFLNNTGIPATRETIFNQIKSHPKAKNNNNIKAKIRQIINSFPKIFYKNTNGTIALN